jgi:hypothetical protein
MTYKIGLTHVTLNTIVAAISTAVRTSLALAMAGPLNQSAGNWFAQPRRAGRESCSRLLEDLDTIGDASSDSISSLRLLWRTRCWHLFPQRFSLDLWLIFSHSNLASIGALIVILSLAFDTFTQQIVMTYTRQVVSTDITSLVTLPRAFAYTGSISGVTTNVLFDSL